MAENIADIDGECTDKITEVDKDGGNNDTREDFFDAVIINAEAANLR